MRIQDVESAKLRLEASFKKKQLASIDQAGTIWLGLLQLAMCTRDVLYDQETRHHRDILPLHI